MKPSEDPRFDSSRRSLRRIAEALEEANRLKTEESKAAKPQS